MMQSQCSCDHDKICILVTFSLFSLPVPLLRTQPPCYLVFIVHGRCIRRTQVGLVTSCYRKKKKSQCNLHYHQNEDLIKYKVNTPTRGWGVGVGVSYVNDQWNDLKWKQPTKIVVENMLDFGKKKFIWSKKGLLPKNPKLLTVSCHMEKKKKKKSRTQFFSYTNCFDLFKQCIKKLAYFSKWPSRWFTPV